MKKKFIYVCFIISVLFLSGFFFMSEKYADRWNVTMNALDVTSSSMLLYILPQREYKKMDIIHKYNYKIEKYEHNVWITISLIPFDYNEYRYDREYEYKKGYSFLLDWSDELGNLDKGHYRIAVDFSALVLDKTYYKRIDDKTFYVEFDII